MKNTKQGRLSIIFSMVIWGTLAPFVRKIAVTSGELALYRAVLAAAMIGIYLLVTKQKISVKSLGKELYFLLFSGIAMGFNWILLFEAYKYTTVAISTLSYYFAPVIVTVACPLLFKEKITPRQILCFVMATFGLTLVIGITNLGQGGNDAVGIAFGLGAAALYATVILLNKYIKGVSGIHRTFLQFLAAIGVLIPYVTFTTGFSLSSLEQAGWICLLIVGLLHTGVTYCLYFSSIKEIPGQEAAILSYVDPLVAVIIGIVVLKEPLSWQQFAGGALILGFTLWNELDTVK
ncbi:MAG: DMT family transporter [Oscillospiraceae bacterium]